MPEQSELRLVDKLLERTMENQVDWQPTGFPSEVTAAFAGKYTILLHGGPLGASLKVKNADGDEIISLDPIEEPRIFTLYGLAKQYVRAQIDAQLADLMKELDKPSSTHPLVEGLRQAREAKASRERDRK